MPIASHFCSIDVTTDPMFDQIMLVPLSQQSINFDTLQEDFPSSTFPSGSLSEETELPDFITNLPLIQHCFAGVDDIQDMKNRCMQLNTKFGDFMVQRINLLTGVESSSQTTVAAVDSWLKITKLAKTETLENIYRMELTANKILLQN